MLFIIVYILYQIKYVTLSLTDLLMTLLANVHSCYSTTICSTHTPHIYDYNGDVRGCTKTPSGDVTDPGTYTAVPAVGGCHNVYQGRYYLC